MMKMIKKALKWYFTRTAQSYLTTPSGMIPVYTGMC